MAGLIIPPELPLKSRTRFLQPRSLSFLRCLVNSEYVVCEKVVIFM